MYVTYTAPRAMAARWLVKGDEIATVPSSKSTIAVPMPLRAPESVWQLGPDLVSWWRVESAGLVNPEDAPEDLDPVGTIIVLTQLVDVVPGCQIEGGQKTFYLGDAAGVVMRQPVEIEELAFIESLIDRVTTRTEDGEALRALIDESDEEGQRDGAGVTSAEPLSPFAVLRQGKGEDHSRADAQTLAAIDGGTTKRLPMRYLPVGVQGAQLGGRELDEDSVTARPIDAEQE